MLKLQIRGELAESTHGAARGAPINADCAALALLEEREGYGQFRIVLPDRALWSERVALIHGMPGVSTIKLDTAIHSYVAEDRRMVVDTFARALETASGYRFTARLQTPDGKIKTVECLGDVSVVDGQVTGAYGFLRDISQRVEREAMAISRARLIRSIVEDVPVPVAVLDRALRVVGCSPEWAAAYGLANRESAIGQPLGALVEVGCETSAAIIEALGGRSAEVQLRFFPADGGPQVERRCAVIPWQCGNDEAGGVIMVVGGGQPAYASRMIADRAIGRETRSLVQMLETLQAA